MVPIKLEIIYKWDPSCCLIVITLQVYYVLSGDCADRVTARHYEFTAHPSPYRRVMPDRETARPGLRSSADRVSTLNLDHGTCSMAFALLKRTLQLIEWIKCFTNHDTLIFAILLLRTMAESAIVIGQTMLTPKLSWNTDKLHREVYW